MRPCLSKRLGGFWQNLRSKRGCGISVRNVPAMDVVMCSVHFGNFQGLAAWCCLKLENTCTVALIIIYDFSNWENSLLIGAVPVFAEERFCGKNYLRKTMPATMLQRVPGGNVGRFTLPSESLKVGRWVFRNSAIRERSGFASQVIILLLEIGITGWLIRCPSRNETWSIEVPKNPNIFAKLLRENKWATCDYQ